MLSEKDLIKGCKDCNVKAQQELYERFVRKMNAVCYYYAGSSDDAKDILHEGFIKVFVSIHKFKGDGSLEGWIRRIMVNTAIDFLKNKKTRPDSFRMHEEIEPEEEEVIETEGEVEFTQLELMEVIKRLPDEHRLIFNMSCLENYSHKDISELLNIREDTCRSKLRRARKMLRRFVEELKQEKLTIRNKEKKGSEV